nr:glycoside hydrolase family 3 N-terminal domain-containing protein [Candidatus Krumholzibacteria bacterium]
MRGRRAWGLVLVWILAGTVQAQDFPTRWNDQSPAEILTSLTLEEKVGQLFIVYHGPAAFMAEHGFGGSLIFSSMVKKPEELQASLAEAQRQCKIPLLVAIDQEGGKVNRLQSVPGLENTPSATQMAEMEAAGIMAVTHPWAEAMIRLGINTNLAPVLDPARGPGGELTLMGKRERAFGSSPEEILAPAGAVMSSLAGNGIGCIVKHFPGYNVLQNSDHELAVSSASLAELEAQIVAFTQAMPRAMGVMMSSIRFTAVSETPAVLDPYWVGRARCGYSDRLVMTDDLWGGALRGWVSGTHTVDQVDYPAEDLHRLVLLAFDAGNDMLMVTFPAKAIEMKAILVEAIPGDPVRQALLDGAVLRILQAKLDLNLFVR